MYIVHIASELSPIAKVGGLADVVSGLSKELKLKGLHVEIIIPKYDCVDYSQVKEFKIAYHDLKSYYDGTWVSNTVWQGLVDDITVFFIEPHNETTFFSRGEFYNCSDNVDRFSYFSRASLEFLLRTGKNPDILHCHDWHTALVPLFYQEIHKSLGLSIKGILFTIHNLEHQGQASYLILDRLGLSGHYFLNPNRLQDPHNPSFVNLMKSGIIYSDYFTTVSPNYAKEVQTIEGGCGLHQTIQNYNYKFDGILNGLDYQYWNPETDSYLPTHYSLKQMSDKDVISFKNHKAANKFFLKKRLSLKGDARPLVGCISRLVPQKGIHLIENALFRTLEKGGEFILLGTSPDPVTTERFHKLKFNLANNSHVHFELQYNEELSHQIFAGCDFFIVPSIFEPCGLTQLIALRYGTVPIVRKTGGLADTIFDMDYADKPFEERNGFTFDHPDKMGVYSALDRAIDNWYNHTDSLQAITLQGMLMDFSWNLPSKEYIDFYNRCCKVQ
ncbi:MAG: glycogen synthase [Chlamydiales bacterium]|nr:glycogen synthase [Chlamydiales bacterium]